MSEEEKLTNGISRRQFIQGATIGTVGLASLGILAGCSPEKSPSDVSEPGIADSSWETPPAPIPDSEIKQTIETDILVVGGGIAGIVAALRAAEQGAKVILIEKNTALRVGGGDNAALGSRLQKQLGIEFDKDALVMRFIKGYDYIPDQRLFRLWTDHSGEIMDWMLDMTEAEGVETRISVWPYPPGYDPDDEYFGVYPSTHVFLDEDQAWSQKPLLNALKNNAVQKGVDIRFSTSALQLIRKDQERVSGLVAKDQNGDYIKFNTGKAVMLCTGDYGNSPEMMQKYHIPEIAELAGANNIYTALMQEQPKEKLNTGDGHKMCLWIGAQMENSPGGSVSTYAFLPFHGSFLRVNNRGERYENEDYDPGIWVGTIVQQPGKSVWQVFDAKYAEDYARFGSGSSGGTSAGEATGEADTEPPSYFPGSTPITDAVRKQVESTALQADTIEELAEKMEVPVEAFKATVARRNELAGIGRDLDFGLAPNRLTSIEQAPFYAIKPNLAFVVTLDGIKVNPRLQPLDKEGAIIPGLYLAGNVVGQRFGPYYFHLTPGLTNGMAWTHAYLAAENAVADNA